MIQIYDTTLRDGTQRTDIFPFCQRQVEHCRRLDDLGIAFIEAAGLDPIPKTLNSSGALLTYLEGSPNCRLWLDLRCK